MGSPALPGDRCFVFVTSSGTEDFSGCPVTDRLAARLQAIDEVAAFPLDADTNYPAETITIGSPTATTAGATVSITLAPVPSDPTTPVFRIDALVVTDSGGWAVDDLLFYGAPDYSGPGGDQWLAESTGGPWSVYDACWTPGIGDYPGQTC
jgi:hypothetical protein